MQQIILTVGDWSHDGHGHTEDIVVNTNLSVKELNAAYRAAVKQTKVELQEKFCVDYEENYISSADIALLKDAGVNTKPFEDSCDYTDGSIEENPDGDFQVFPKAWAKLWLEFCKLGNPTLEWKIVESHKAMINIGGYGLFFS